MTALPLVSVVIVTRNAGTSFGETMGSLKKQSAPFAFEVVIVDSGSIDGTPEEAASRGFRVHRIHPAEFDHGHTRNFGAALATGSIVVYLVQDALPADEHWLEALTAPLRESDAVAGSYGRVLPRPNANALLRRSVLAEANASEARRIQRLAAGERFLDLDPEERRLRANFNNVSSAVRKDVLARLPFRRGRFAEDLGFGRAALEAGYSLAYEPEAVVLHSHEYGAREMFRRTLADGWANREIVGRTCIPSARLALIHAIGQVAEDWRFLRGSNLSRRERLSAARRSPALRAAEAAGLWLGARRAAANGVAFDVMRPLEVKPLRILLVAHSFPPETWAGTEVYTLELARELRRRGHEVFIVHRCADRTKANYALDCREWDGFQVFRIANHLEYSGIAETYSNEAIEEKFRWVLGTVHPEVVHFQHALHLSTGCLRIARESGAAVLLTLHDYWFICPKVQLIRPDHSLCRLRRPGLGCVACSNGRTAAIRFGKAVTPVMGPVLRALVRAYGALVRRTPQIGRRLLNDAVALERRSKVILSDLAAADLLLAPSPFLRDRYVGHGVPPGRIVVCRNGVGVRQLRGVHRSPSDRLRVAFTGSLVWWKGLDVLIEAFNRLPRGRARLDIYADHESNPAVRSYHRELTSRVRVLDVTFHGGYSSERLPAIYSEIDVLVVPSLWYENSPLAVQEAFAAGAPVVASRLGALPGLVRDGVDGLLFQPGDPEDLARVLKRLLDEPNLLAELRSNSPRVKDVEEHADELLIHYRQFLGRIPGPHTNGQGRFPLPPTVEIWAPHFHSEEGRVQRQGRDLVLLSPVGHGRSGVAYDFHLKRESACRLEVETQLLEGEHSVILAGSLTLNGRPIGTVPEHRFHSGTPLRRRHAFDFVARPGRNRLYIANSPGPDPKRGLFHLRVRRILVYETAAETPPR